MLSPARTHTDPRGCTRHGFVQRKATTAAIHLAFDSMEKLRIAGALPWATVMRAADRVGAGPRGPVVFECVGVPGMIQNVVDAAPFYSRIVVVGVCMEADRITPSVAINKEVSLQFVLAYDPADFHEAMRLMAGGKISPATLHTGTVSLDDVAGAFDDLGSAEGHAKILIDPSA